MSDSEQEDWKKHELYAKDEDSDYVEEEKEARRLQDKSLARIIDMGLVEDADNQENSEEEENKAQNILDDSDDDNKLKFKLSEKTKKELLSYAIEVENTLKEVKAKINPIILLLKDQEETVENPKTIEYFENKKSLMLTYASCLSYFIVHRTQNLINDFHPVVKRILSLKNLLSKLNDKNLFKNIDKLIEKIEILNEDDDEDDIQEEEEEEEVEQPKLLNKKRKNSDRGEESKEELYKKKDEDQKLKKENIIKDSFKTMENKNKLAADKANKELARGRGMYRKRKAKQGNAKLMNKIKFEKKDKVRKRYVKEFTEAPLVYTGESTGIRRDLSRSIKFKN